MEQTSFPVEYDFKCAKLDLVDKDTGKIKNKYKCLPLMITLPLSKPLDPLGLPNQSDSLYKQTILKSTNSTNGWMNFIPFKNIQPNIITILPNTLLINNFRYNYDITVKIINKGNDNVDLRFMAQNPFSLLASNMNDINLDETVFSNVYDGQKIKFTVTGEYQFFYVNYPTTNFNINIIITVSDRKTPIFICDKKFNKCQKCTCFDIKGNGYIRLKKKDEFIYVPVYTTRIIGNTITQYLYPEFGYLRDLFYNITLLNSLDLPTSSQQGLKFITTVVKATFGENSGPCNNANRLIYLQISGDLVQLYNVYLEPPQCPPNWIRQITESKCRYSWSSILVARSIEAQNAFLGVYSLVQNQVYVAAKLPLDQTTIRDGYYYYILPSGFYDEQFRHSTLYFALIRTNNNIPLDALVGVSFDITITEI